MSSATPQKTPQHTAFEKIRSDLASNSARIRVLAEAAGEDRWQQRSTEGKWSLAEGVVHLCLTTEAYLPLMGEALTEAKEHGLAGTGKPRGTVIGGLLRFMMEPPVRARLRTTAPFVPGSAEPIAVVLERFEEGQNLLLELLEGAEGLAIHRQKMASPFDPRIRYDLYSAFRILAAHQRRHLWIADRLLDELGAS